MALGMVGQMGAHLKQDRYSELLCIPLSDSSDRIRDLGVLRFCAVKYYISYFNHNRHNGSWSSAGIN